jgi:hypothetical protein
VRPGIGEASVYIGLQTNLCICHYRKGEEVSGRREGRWGNWEVVVVREGGCLEKWKECVETARDG